MCELYAALIHIPSLVPSPCWCRPLLTNYTGVPMALHTSCSTALTRQYKGDMYTSGIMKKYVVAGKKTHLSAAKKLHLRV